MAETRYLGRSTNADGVSYDCFVGIAGDCPVGWFPPAGFLEALGGVIAEDARIHFSGPCMHEWLTADDTLDVIIPWEAK